MRFLYIFLILIPLSTNYPGFSQNVMISDQNHPNEPSIMMDPLHPENLIAATNINNYYISSDTGKTWTAHSLSSSFGVWGDPCIDVDTEGNFYFFHLSDPPSGNWIDRIICQKTTNNGATWSDGTYTGLNGSKVQDKQWSVIDRNNNNIYVTWTQFDVYGSPNPADSSIILFSKSTDGGETWSQPKRINEVAGDCVDGDNTVEGAVPAVGPNGEIYVSWAGPLGLIFDKSTDQGETWLDEDIFVMNIPGGWAFNIPGIYRCNGLPITKCDLSGGEYNGTIYINWSDQRNGTGDTDIWLVKSANGGITWCKPIRVNDDIPGKQQFFTWMDIDQTTGYLYFIFYDRRNYSGNQTDVYLAISKDGGNTFENILLSESPFIPNHNVFFGDYNNITAHNGIVRPIWIRLEDGQLSVWTDITPTETTTSVKNKIENLVINDIAQYPNPAKNISYISFKLRKTSKINLSIYNQLGEKVHTIIDNEKKDYGKYVIPIDIDALNLPAGNYFYKLSIDGISKTLRTIVVK